MDLIPHHGPHRAVGRGRFPVSSEIWRAASVLNRVLKSRGLLFGVHREGDEDVLTIYDVHPEEGDPEPGT